jgi:hypothetical protein
MPNGNQARKTSAKVNEHRANNRLELVMGDRTNQSFIGGAFVSLPPTGRKESQALSAGLSFLLLLVRQYHAIDHVNYTVAGGDIGCGYFGLVDHYAAFGRDGHAATFDRFHRTGFDVSGHDFSGNDVVGQHFSKHRAAP